MEKYRNHRKLKKLGTWDNNTHLQWGEINDIEDGVFYGLSAISNKEKRKFKKNYRWKLMVMDIPFRPTGRY